VRVHEPVAGEEHPPLSQYSITKSQLLLKRSAKADRDMQGAFGQFPARSNDSRVFVHCLIAALNCGSESAKASDSFRFFLSHMDRSNSISIICARYSPRSTPPAAVRNTTIMRSKYHCMTARSA